MNYLRILFQIFSRQPFARLVLTGFFVFFIIVDVSLNLCLLSLIAFYLQSVLPEGSQISFSSIKLSFFASLFPSSFFIHQESIAITTISFAVVSLFSRIFVEFSTYRLSGLFASQICTNYFKSFLRLPYLVIASSNSSTFVSRCTYGAFVLADTLVALFQSLYAFVFIFAVSIFLLFTSPLVYLAAIVPAGTVYFVYYLLSHNYLRLTGQIEKIASASSIQILQQAISSVKDVIIYNLYDQHARVFSENDRRFRLAHSSNVFVASSPKFILEVFAIVFLPLTGIYSSFSGISFLSFIPALAVVLAALQKVTPQIQSIFRSFAVFNANKVAIIELLLPNTTSSLPIPNIASKFASDKLVKLSLNSVTFFFPNVDRPALLDCTIDFHVGSSYAIFGKTGSGKSTLLNVIIGLLPPTSGQVFLHDHYSHNLINCYNTSDLLQLISHVSQDVFLHEDTILFNITLEPHSVDLNYVVACAKAACIHDFIISLPDGYNTYLGERGSNLSGGQRQRIGICKALYKKRPVLVMDEATSALDPSTEKSVITNIMNFCSDRIVVLVTHRLSTLEFFDYGIEVDAGIVRTQYIGKSTTPSH